MSKTIVIDTETTGLSFAYDEVLQVSIIDDAGTVLFDSYFKPCNASRWDEAEAVNGISPDMVADAPYLTKRLDELNIIIGNADTIIGYNTEFDLNFLLLSGLDSLPTNVKIIDVMDDFAKIYGEWDNVHDSYKWQKLTTAADYYGYDWSSHAGKAHNSLSDCFATLFVHNKISEGAKPLVLTEDILSR